MSQQTIEDVMARIEDFDPVLVDEVNLSVKHDVSKEARDANGKWTRLKMTSATVDMQEIAQHVAEKQWKDAVRPYTGGDEPDFDYDADTTMHLDPSDPVAGWAFYQCQMYGAINKYLRTGEDTDTSAMTNGALKTKASVLAASTIKAFDTMGFTTNKPITLFRVDQGVHTSVDSFHVGDVVTEKGVTSAAANPDEVAGFLEDNLVGSPTAFVLQIEVPTGTRVLGGYTGGIETMLKPGSKFKVTGISNGILGQRPFTAVARRPVVHVELLP